MQLVLMGPLVDRGLPPPRARTVTWDYAAGRVALNLDRWQEVLATMNPDERSTATAAMSGAVNDGPENTRV